MAIKEALKEKYPIIIIVIIPILMHLPIWLGIVDFYSGDASDLITYFYGTKSLLYQAFQEHREIALWNPYIMFGQPVVGNIQYALFYPLNIIFMLVSFFKALPYYQIIHLIIAGSGTYMLCQYTGCKKISSTIASLLLILNSRIIYYINVGWLSYFSAMCWLPFFVFLSLKTIRDESLYNPIGLSIIFAMSFLSGTPQYAFLGFYLFIISGVIQLFYESSKNNRIHLMFRIFLVALFSFLLTGIQLLPAIEQAYLSTRPAVENQIIGFYFQWDIKQWFRILVRPELIQKDFAWELCAYMGIGGLALSFIGLLFKWKDIRIISIWGIIPMLMSMGPEVPILSKIINYAPGLSMLTNPSRYFIFTIIVLSLLSGHGLDYILNGVWKKNRLFCLMAVLCLGLVTAGFFIKPYEQSPQNIYFRYLSTICIFFTLATFYIYKKNKIAQYIFLLWLIVDPLLYSKDILLMEKYFIKDLTPPSKIINAIKTYTKKHPRIASIQSKDAWNNNLLTPLEDWIFITKKIDRASGYEPLGMRKSHSFAAKMDGTETINKSLWGYRLWSFKNERLYNLGGITHLITSEPKSNPSLKLITTDIMTLPHFHGGWWKEKKIFLYENINSYPRAFLINSQKDLRITPVNIKILSPNTRQLLFRTDTPQLLIISESFNTGWVAKSQTAEIKIEPFLDCFMSLKIPPGEYKIQLEFKPRSLFNGFLFTMTGIVLIFIFILYQYRIDYNQGMKSCD